VRSKTGTLNGKSCLSGYVGDGSEILAFSILVEGLRGRSLSAVRHAQVQIVDAVMRYARGATGIPPAEEQTPGVDYENGEDAIEGDEEESADAPGLPGAPIRPASPQPGAPPLVSQPAPPAAAPVTTTTAAVRPQPQSPPPATLNAPRRPPPATLNAPRPVPPAVLRPGK
jgi:hypothetical protein